MLVYPIAGLCRSPEHHHAFRNSAPPSGRLRTGLIRLLFLTAVTLHAKGNDIDSLKELSLDQLMNVEVTSVSLRPQRLSETASAIQAINGTEIVRSTAANVPDALRLLPNVRVAQVNSYAWVVTTRGFSNIFANKLLVLVDGRTVYTPLFGGVFWDAQTLLLEDLDRIEAISGPGGTLWGENAVNGVINITTKSARDTQGGYVLAGGGSLLEDIGALRYGGKIGPNLYYRVYAQTFHRGPTDRAAGSQSLDAWTLDSAGMRVDWYPSEADTLTLQANLYDGREHTASDAEFTGHDVIARWTRQTASDQEIGIQLYQDRSWRRSPADYVVDELETYDLQFHHRFQAGVRHSVVWGGGYRFMHSRVVYDTPFIAFLPPRRNMELFSGFALDEIALRPKELTLSIGSKIEHNSFSGWELQPSARLAWTLDEKQTAWAAVSRAIRAPSRLDVDYHLPGIDIAPGTPGVDGGPNFDSEKVLAYEAGYRWQPAPIVALSLATFYNRYDDLYSVEALPGTPTYQIQNGSEGHTWGAEFSGEWQVRPGWHLRGGYTYFRERLGNRPGHQFDTTLLGNDPRHQWSLHSILDLPANVQLDADVRAASALPHPALKRYAVFDIRLGWTRVGWELSLNAENLGAPRHAEFDATTRIPVNVYGRIVYRW